MLIRELEGKSTDIKERDDAGKPDVSGNLNPDLDTTAENSQVDATSLAPQSYIPEGVETEPSLEQPNLDIAEVSKPRAYVVSPWRSLLFMIVFLASIPVTPVLYSASDNEVARAVVLLVPFCFFLLWVYYAVKALHLIGVHFWKLRSTRASLILIAVVICIAVLFFIGEGKVELVYAGGIVVFGFVIFMLRSNYTETQLIPLTLALTILQAFVFVAGIILLFSYFAYLKDKETRRRY